MRRYLGWVGWPLFLALVLPALGADPKKTDTDKKSAAADDQPAKIRWVSAGEAVGTIKNVDASQKHLKLEVESTTTEPKVTRGRVTYTPKTVKTSHDLVATDDVSVRRANPPVDYDEKGNPKTYTSKELKDLKGPGNLAGYPADFDNLKNGMVVKVMLVKRAQPVAPAPSDPKDKEAVKEAVKEAAAANQPKVRTIYILKEAK